MSALAAWADHLAAWAIPQPLLDRATDSPWVLPRQVFARRADQQMADPIGASYRDAAAALTRPGAVLDVGAGAGAASLPLAGRTAVTHVTAVDSNERLLDAFGQRAARLGLPARLVHGTWPEVAEQAGTADLVVCGHVLYNVPDLSPFVRQLTAHARVRVVVEITGRHPLAALNPLWQRLHGITRPTGPTADDCLAALTELGIHPRVTRWSRPPTAEYADLADMVEVTRRRLCLPADAAAEVELALRELGVDPAVPPDLGSSGRDLVTLTWDGTAV